jgi:hypothetical protein
MKRILIVILIFMALTLLASLVMAQNGELAVPWFKIAGGGSTSSDGARFTLSGTIGQLDAGRSSDDASYTLQGGYWNAAITVRTSKEVYLPLVILSE